MRDEDNGARDPWVVGEIAPFLAGEVLNKTDSEMTAEECALAYAILQYVEKTIDGRKGVLRERLLEEAEKRGARTEKGGNELELDGFHITREKRQDKLPDSVGVKSLLIKAKLSVDSAFTRRTSLVLDPSKLEQLVDLGKLKSKDLNALRAVNWALKVASSTVLEEQLEQAAEDVREALAEEKPTRAKRSGAVGARKKRM